PALIKYVYKANVLDYSATQYVEAYIALIDELRSRGVTPKKVADHSSEVITAVYCAGAHTQRGAVAIAYIRGKDSSGLAGLKGGIMAVGCSYDQDQARSFLAQNEENIGGVTTVICVDSPISVTILGASAAFKNLRTILKKESMFADIL
ncbi:Highly reducing polyketide synthase cla2, partial [Colletotrichum gloeosporioides]